MIQLPQTRDPEPDQREIVKRRLYIPVIDNGSGNVRKGYAACCEEFLRHLSFHKDFSISDSLAPRARNKAAATFLLSDCEYLLFIDTDIQFTRQNIDNIMESDAPVLAGLYCKKSLGVDPCLNTLPGMQPTECGGYIPIRRAGTGFLRIHREVLEKMKEPDRPQQLNGSSHIYAKKYTNHGRDEWDFFSVGVVDREYLSEDWYFCDRARALGYDVLLDSRVQVLHEGNIVFPIRETIPKNISPNGEQNTVVITAQ